jgi:SAM-dependent methyltransferase
MIYQPVQQPDGHYICSPTPSIEELQKYYQEEFFESEKPGFINDSAKEVRDNDSDFYNTQYSIFSKLLGLDKSDFHVDLGCGYGHYLEYLSTYYPNLSLQGCEVYPEAANYIEQIKGAVFKQIDLNTLSNLSECIRKASTISMINTLEHLQDPKKFLRECRSSLRADAKLLIQVPNDFNPIQIAAVSQLGLDQWWFCPPRHVSYFSPTSLSSCIKSAGLVVKDLVTTFPIDMFLIAGLNYRNDPMLGRKAHEMRLLFETNYCNANGLDSLIHLYRTFATAGIGREIIAVVQSA